MREFEISDIVNSVHNMTIALKNHRLYPQFVKVRDRLCAHQFVCWIAGGAVRDFLIGREVADFDLVTDASTEVLVKLFPDAVMVGIAFGVLKIPVGSGDFFDLATFREESDYLDGRRPSQVKASSPVNDSIRRDFTVNAIFYDDQAEELRDYQGGLFDLQQKVLKCVGDPRTRFGEDYLRILRLARFSLQLGFDVEAETLVAAKELVKSLEKVSGERIWSELKKLEKSNVLNQALSSIFLKQILSVVLRDREIANVEVDSKDQCKNLNLEAFLYLINKKKDYSSDLRARLKVSGVELEKYKNIKYILDSLQTMPFEEIVYELEKSENLFLQLRSLVLMGLVDSIFLKNVEKLQAEHREPFVSASQLSSLIPPRQISRELRFIRVGQLSKFFKSPDEVLVYLKKKYAENVT